MAVIRKVHTSEFKLAALARMDEAANIQVLALELGIERSMLYRWHRTYISGGAEALRTIGRPRPLTGIAPEAAAAADAPPDRPPETPAGAQGRIAELERKIGQQQLELDFFREALRHVREARRLNGASGGTASTR